jgi:hypothetical protein
MTRACRCSKKATLLLHYRIKTMALPRGRFSGYAGAHLKKYRKLFVERWLCVSCGNEQRMAQSRHETCTQSQRLEQTATPCKGLTNTNDASAPERETMGRTNHRTLVDRGRKAGLRTSELYGALVSSRPEGADLAPGVGDSNGFVCDYDQHGQRVYRQPGENPKP